MKKIMIGIGCVCFGVGSYFLMDRLETLRQERRAVETRKYIETEVDKVIQETLQSGRISK